MGRDVIAHVQNHRPITVSTARMANPAHFPLVHALTQHTMRLGSVAIDLYERDLKLEAAPTIRMAYECALTACWLADSREGVAAIFNEHARQRTNLAASFRESFSEVFREGADTISGVGVERLETIANAQAKNFKDLCYSLGRPDAYALYRALSTSCHATPDIADAYIDERPEAPTGIHLRLEPQETGHDAWLFTLVAAMVWAARALDTMDQDRSNRNYLRGLARRLNVPELLRLTEEARAAEDMAERDRRRRLWKGPRRKATPRRVGDDSGSHEGAVEVP